MPIDSAPAADTGWHVLLLASSREDEAALRFALRAAEIETQTCADVRTLSEAMGERSCAAVIAEELLNEAAAGNLASALRHQPPWSDFPLIILTRGEFYGPGWRFFERVGQHAHVNLLQRPVRAAALVSAVQAARQSRLRQYEVRDELAARREAEFALRDREAQLEQTNESLESRVRERTDEIQMALERLRRLARDLTETEQRERRKLAKMLHDGLQQVLVAVKIQIQASVKDPEQLSRLDALVSEAISMSRTLAHEMSPPILDNSDLPEVLHWIARKFGENFGFNVSVTTPENWRPLDDQNLKAFIFQAVRELLLNAVKHSSANSARVALSEADDASIRIEVADNGAGFDPAVLEGKLKTGFGLLSVRERARALDGTLFIETGRGHGARFVLTLPRGHLVEEPTPAARPQAESRDVAHADRVRREGPPFRIIVADDHRIVREGIVALLEREADFEIVAQAADGAEAVELAWNLHPDVVVMDINMPRMDGIAATRIIRERCPDVRVVGLSFATDREKTNAMLDAGAAAYVQKDADLAPLIDSIRAASEWRAHAVRT